MKRAIALNGSLIEHWNQHLKYKGNEIEHCRVHSNLCDDIRQLEIELENVPDSHFLKKRSLEKQYLHWLFLLEVVGSDIGEKDIPF